MPNWDAPLNCRLTSIETINNRGGEAGEQAKVSGVGKKLMNELAQEANDNNCTTISIGSAARTATDFYKKCGFLPDPERIEKLFNLNLPDKQINKMANDQLVGNVGDVISMTTS